MPMNKDHYPLDWKAISQRIRFDRAGGKCEQCGAPHGEMIQRQINYPANWRLAQADDSEGWGKPVRVILTTAHHPDPDPKNCNDDNLHAWCQRCHLRADIALHQTHAHQTRQGRRAAQREASGQLTLFSE